jgi:hypothetical protein
MRGSVTFPALTFTDGTTHTPQWFLDSISNLHLVYASPDYLVQFNVSVASGSPTTDFSYQAKDQGSAQRIIDQINALIQSGSTVQTAIVDVASPTISGAAYDGTILTVTGTALLGAAFITIFPQSWYPIALGNGIQFATNPPMTTDTNVQTYAATIGTGVYDVQIQDANLNQLAYLASALTV